MNKITKDEILKLLKQAKLEKKEDIKEAIGILENAKQLLEGDRGSQQTRRNETSGDKDEIVYLYKYGNILYGAKEYGRALKYYEEIVEKQPDVNAYKALGDCLRKLNLYDKALKQYKTALERTNPADKDKAAVLNSRGLTYIAKAIDFNSYGSTHYTPKMDNKKALKDFEKAIEIIEISEDDPNPLYYCNKGIALYTLGRWEQGSDSFKTAEQLVKDGYVKELTEQNKNYIKDPLAYFKELERVKEIQKKFEEIKNKLNTGQFQQEVQQDFDRLLEVYNSFQKNYNELLELVKSNVLKQENIEELTKKMNQVKEDLQHQLDQVNNRMQEVEEKIEIVEADIAEIKQKLDIIYSELSKTLQDHRKALEEYLDTHPSLNGTDKANIKEYYNAFVGTIAATYITAQVVDSGKVELEKPLTLKLISAIFSLIPLGGETLSKGAELASIPISSLISCVSSIGEKIFDEAIDTGIHKTSKEKAKNIKRLANDSSDLSQTVSGAAIKIVTNTDKQKQIINITIEYLNKQPGKALHKMKEFFKKKGQEYEKSRHGVVYSTAAELLGKKDAKTLIKQYLKYSPQVGFEEAVQVIMQDCVHYVVNIDKIREEVSKGSCTQELRDLFSKRYLEPKLKQSLNKDTISDQEMEKAQMRTFKYMCKAVKEAEDHNKAMACVKDFANTTQYKDMVKKVADKHPEYFYTKEIAEQIITEKQILDKVLKKTSNFM